VFSTGTGRATPLAACALVLLAAGCLPLPAAAFTVSIGGSLSANIYLQIGTGNGSYTAGTLGNNSTISTVSVAVPAGVVGSGTPQAMSVSNAVTASAYNGRTFCSANQLYIGAYYQPFLDGIFGSGASAPVTVSVPASLTDATGDTIPFSTISWTSSGIGDSGTEPFPNATFTPGTQTVGSIAPNQWAESCWSFSYANGSVLPPGTYSATLTYTAALP
jgi:hypothetical protein